MEIKKLVKTKVNRARIIGGLVKDSLVLHIKRKALRKRFQISKVANIIVDMDGTVFSAESSLEALSVKYPEKVEHEITLGEDLYWEKMNEIKSGKLTVEEAIIEGFENLTKREFTRKDMDKTLKIVLKSLRKDLIRELKKLKKKKARIILATHSAKEFGEVLNERLIEKYNFSFDGIVGTTLNFNKKGILVGIKEIIGTKNTQVRGINVKTKLEGIKTLFNKKKWNFDIKESVLITDSYGDIDLAKNITTILIKVDNNPTLIQKLSQRLKLADYIVDENNITKEMEEIFNHKESS